MPPDRPPPEGELPFGPRNLSMFRLGWESVVLRGGNFGYRFGAKDAESRTLHLGWRVNARLWSIDAMGRARREVGEIQRRLGDVDDLELLEFAFPASKQGLYRFDISFHSLRGRALGSYREYFRVVPRTVKTRLALNAKSLRPGEVAYARVENLGSADMNVPSRYLIERFDGTAWLAVAESTTPGTSLSFGEWWIAGGEAAPCTEYLVPPDAPPGTYRMRTSVQPFGPRPKRRSLEATFLVVA
jgi:hypothetical protein